MNMLPQHLSTSTPASEISSASFRDDMDGGTESNAPSLDDILRNSPAAAMLGLKPKEESLPDEDNSVPAPGESEEEVPEETSEESESEAEEEEGQEETTEEETEEDDKSTPEGDLPKEEDIDWEYKVPVTIDGKTSYVTLEEIRKGYSTDQHLSQKGRELGELKKKVEEERNTKLNELVTLGTVLHEELSSAEKEFATQYKTLSDDIKKAKAEGDTYTARELKEKQEEVQEKYWELRKKREEHTKKVVSQIEAKQTEEQQKLLDTFAADIKVKVPNFDEKVAKSIREFAINEGVPEGLLDIIYDANVVKFINDYRLLKTAKDTGAAKRKAAPAVKSIPSKKGIAPATRQVQQQHGLRQKVLSGGGSQADELSFLKNISKVSQKL